MKKEIKESNTTNANFYRLVSTLDEETMMIDIVPHEDLYFTLGERFIGAIPEPIQFEVDTEVGGTRLPTLFLPEPVFSVDFLKMLQDCGVDTIDDYAIEIRDNKNAICSFSAKYRAVNIISSLDCVDMVHSEYEKVEDLFFFDKLVLNTLAAKGAEFFRVYHAEEHIVVSHSLASRMDLSQFPDIVLEPLASV